MVKRVEITYEGGHKSTVQYTSRYNANDKGIARFWFHDKCIEVNMNKVLQIKELS